MVPTMLVHEIDGSWKMCFDCQAFKNFFIHEEVRFNIRQKAEQYEKQENEGYQRLVFALEDGFGYTWEKKFF